MSRLDELRESAIWFHTTGGIGHDFIHPGKIEFIVGQNQLSAGIGLEEIDIDTLVPYYQIRAEVLGKLFVLKTGGTHTPIASRQIGK